MLALGGGRFRRQKLGPILLRHLCCINGVLKGLKMQCFVATYKKSAIVFLCNSRYDEKRAI